MKRIKWKPAIKAVMFTVVVFLSAGWFFRALMYKDMGGGGGWQRFYAAESNSIDVLFYGSSHCHCTVDNGLLWTDYGIASYNLTAGSQLLDATYYFMEESLKTQDPKVMAVELLMLGSSGGTDQAGIYRNTLGMRWGSGLFNYLKEAEENSDWNETFAKQVLLKFPVIHSRYKELVREDFEDDIPYLRGYRGSFERVAFERPEACNITGTGMLTESDEKFLNKMIELCRRENIGLVFFAAPFVINEDQQMRFNAAEQFAQENGIPFINFNNKYDEIGFDFQTDMREESHVNNAGARKVTDYLAKLLKDNYEIPDRRGDAGYSQWELNSRYLENLRKSNTLERQEDITAYFNALSAETGLLDGDYVTIVSLDGNYRALGDVFNDCLTGYGIDWEGYERGGVRVRDGDRFVYDSAGQESYEWDWRAGKENIHLKGWTQQLSGEEQSKLSDIYIGDKNCKTVENGVNIVIYDPILNRIVDKAGINVYEGLMITREESQQ